MAALHTEMQKLSDLVRSSQTTGDSIQFAKPPRFVAYSPRSLKDQGRYASAEVFYRRLTHVEVREVSKWEVCDQEHVFLRLEFLSQVDVPTL